jgi:Fe-S cluster assembly protein SufD
VSILEVVDRLVPSAAGAIPDTAWTWLQDHGLPTDRDEAWRYTPLARIVTTPYGLATPSARPKQQAFLELLGQAEGPRVVCVNGRLDPSLSSLEDLAPGLRCEALAPRTDCLHLDDDRLDGFRLLNSMAGGGAAILVSADVHLSSPVEVVHVFAPGDGPTVVHPRTYVDVRARGRLVVIERYLGFPGAGLTNAATTITAGRGAEIDHYRIEDDPDGVDHVGHTSARLADEASVRSTSILLGGLVARSASDTILHGHDARLVLRGLSLGAGDQHHDTVATVEHAGSRCASDQLFSSVVDGHAHASFSGHVIVQAGTTGTAAHQMTRNLVLTRTAEVATRPWLEILADDVQCTHGATVGRLSDEGLFYLRSRGIPEASARRMLIAAFVQEVVDDIQPTGLRTGLELRIERWLESEASN